LFFESIKLRQNAKAFANPTCRKDEENDSLSFSNEYIRQEMPQSLTKSSEKFEVAQEDGEMR
jgi:hypothetical protein